MKKDAFYIVRTYSAGVWLGKLKELDGQIAVITEARRLWYWSGAASLSQLANEGTKRPNDCRFCVTIKDEQGVYLPQVIEILPVTELALDNIKAVKEWKI